MLFPFPTQKKCSPLKKNGKKRSLIAGDPHAIAVIKCLPGCARFADPVFGQLHVLGQSNFYPYKFFLGSGQATLQVKVFSWLPFGNQLFWFTLQIWILRTLRTTPYQQSLLFTWLGVLERKISVEHVLHVARIQSFKPRPNSHELGIVGSVRTSNFLIKGKLNLKKKLGYGDFKADLPTLTIFYLFSRTHDIRFPISRFLGKIILKWNVTLWNKVEIQWGMPVLCWDFL